MNVSLEVMEKVAGVLKNQEAVDKMNSVSTKEEVFAIACEYIAGISQEEFSQAIQDIKEADGCIELSEADLDSVAGGTQGESAHVSLSNISVSAY